MGNEDQHPARPPIPAADTLEWREAHGTALDLEDADSEMRERGSTRVRTLVQLRRSLPLEPESRVGIPLIATRRFDPTRDRADLLTVNNAAFDWHPEQGHWDLDRLEETLEESWVDPDGILVHDSPFEGSDQGRVPGIDGFCWTRIHPADDPEVLAAGDPALGEIWVIAAHPVRHGTRLGPALVSAGLDHLDSRGLGTAMLYTEEDNASAMRMYDRLGFTVHLRRGGYAPVVGSA